MNRDRLLEWWRVRRADATVVALVAVFFALFFARVFADHRFIIKADALFYTYPLRTVAWEMLRSGQLPLWTPLLLSGYPLVSVALLAVCYPLTWGHLFLPGHWAEQVYALAPFLLSPLTTYAYAREIGRSRLAAMLAGLSFGYGGMMCGILSYSGMLTNSLLWCPLVLLFIDRARRRPFARCLLGATAAYAMSVLAGHAQSYIYAGALAFAYGLFISVLSVANAAGKAQRPQLKWVHWRPLAVATCALALAFGVAAVQLFETFSAARTSVRSALSYEVFSEGSFTLREALLSLGAQIYHYVDSGTYVPPLALILALVAIVCAALRTRVVDARVWFWTVVAIVAFLLLLGANTPLNRVVYQVPVLNKFRVPSRHTFEWTFAVSILAAYGWDAAAAYLARRRARTVGAEPRKHNRHARYFKVLAVLALLTATTTVGLLWWRAIVQWREPNQPILTALPERSYWLWKLGFTALVLALTWCGFKLVKLRPLRKFVLVTAIALACFVEAHATVACWWAGFGSLPKARFETVSGATRFLQQFSPTENRVYTRVAMFSEEFNAPPRLEAANLTMLHGLHNVAGMEPLISERYSRALSGVGPDSVMPRGGLPPNDDLFGERSHVLDLLNTTHIVTYAGTLQIVEDPVIRREGIAVSKLDLSSTLPPGASVQLTGSALASDQLALVTSLSNSVTEPQGSLVARVLVLAQDGRRIELNLRAGIDTAEWAHERPDVRAVVAHELATVFDGRPGDSPGSFTALRYWTRLQLGAALAVRRVEISNVSSGATLSVWKASLANAGRQTSTLLTRETRSASWMPVYEYDRVQILRNSRALPRAWLVGEAEAVDGEEALHRVRGESPQAFDPRRTALLEVRPDELPSLPGGAVSTDSSARIVSYEPARLVIETSAPTATVLVLSEMFHPGWEATVDGRATRIMLTDYLLRGVALEPGRHRVEMTYTAPAARMGAIVSAGTLFFLGGLFVYARRRDR